MHHVKKPDCNLVQMFFFLLPATFTTCAEGAVSTLTTNLLYNTTCGFARMINTMGSRSAFYLLLKKLWLKYFSVDWGANLGTKIHLLYAP